MEISVLPGLIAGVTAGVAMSLSRTAIRAAGMPLRMDVARTWAALVGVRGDATLWVGLAIHLVVSVVAGFAYAAAFQALPVTDRLILWGLVGGVIHYVVAGLALAAMPAVHPDVPGRSPAPGTFARHLGMTDMLAFLVAHIVFGLVFGLVYGAIHPQGGWPVAL